MKAVILAGGKGTRMGNLAADCPKPMISLAGKPILEHQIVIAKRYGLTDIIMLTGYKEDVIKNYFGAGEDWGVKIDYYSDPNPLGTAGSVKEIELQMIDPFLLFYGDTMMDINLKALVDFHNNKEGLATLVVHPNDHPNDSDLLAIDESNRVTAFYSKPHDLETYHRNLVNAALYILTPEVFEYIEKDTFSDFGKDIFPRLISLDKAIYAYNTTEYIKDIGTVERLKEVEEDYLSGQIARLNKDNKQKAIFIDRDGVINFESDPLDRPDKFRLIPGVEEALGTVNRSDYLAVVVTNQPIIAKGFASEKQVQEIHNYMEYTLGQERAYLDRIYYCPHHPEKGFKGERKEYKVVCKCRKPGTGMIDKAVKEMNIELSQSFIIGDRTVDIMTGINTGMHTVLVRQGYAGEDKKYACRPDFIFNDLLEAVQFIVHGYNNLINNVKTHLPARFLKGKDNLIVVIGGLSRSGKSTLSAVVRKYLEQVGRQVKTLELDNWLLSQDQRTPSMDVRDRYQYEIIENDIKALLNGKRINLNRYDPKTREIKKNADGIFLTPGDVLLIDGVVALDHEYIRKTADVSFFTHVPEELRKKRFYDFYCYKSMTEKEIDTLYQNRIPDEVIVIERSKEHANHIIDMDFSI